jgi:protein gp37
MSEHSDIEWTDATWNPVRGCTKISPGCAHCLDPDTLVLMADWTSRKIKDLREGDTVVAFEEGPEGVGLTKVSEKATVERVWWTRKPAVRITTDDGGSLVASTDHLFLKPQHGWFKAGNARVLQTRFRRIVTADLLGEMSAASCAGYLTGATDGDGTMPERGRDTPYSVLTCNKKATFGSRIEGQTPRVVSVEYVGERDLVDIQTSKRTFVANGYLTHNCYAETFAERFRGVPGHPYEHGFDLRLVPEKLPEPLRWKTAKMVFVNSMSDLCHEDVPDDYVLAVVRVMQIANWHTYQVLTKRSERLRDLLQTKLALAAQEGHIWWGVSVENRKHGLPRIDHLRGAPAKVRFLSIEPLLEDLGPINLDGIHWVIAGGESGPGARPLEKAWVVSIRDQCQQARVPFFFKQWGGVRKSKAGRQLDGRTYDEFPARIERPVLEARSRLAAIEEIACLYPAATPAPATAQEPDLFAVPQQPAQPPNPTGEAALS